MRHEGQIKKIMNIVAGPKKICSIKFSNNKIVQFDRSKFNRIPHQ